MLNKSIVILFVALFAISLSAESYSISGCDIDRDEIEDKVTAKRCTLKESTEELLCSRVDYRLSDSDNIKVIKKFSQSKKRALRRFSQLTCHVDELIETEDERVALADKIDTNHNIWGRSKKGKIRKIKVQRTATKSALSEVCKGTRAMRSCEVWKARASAHIPSGDPRKYSSSWIALRGCPGSFNGCIQAYDKNGGKIHSLGEYPNSISAYDSRHYGGTGCGDRKTPDNIGNEARARTGSPEIYLKDDAGICVRVPNADICYNSREC